MSPPRLAIAGVCRRFTGLVAVDDVSFAVAPGTVHGLIGPNGAGKTTLFNLISGLLPPSAGGIFLEGDEITALPPHRRARLGLGRTFQNIRIFGEMSLLENVMTGRHGRLGVAWPAVVLRLGGARREEAAAKACALALLRRVGLAARAEQPAQMLAYGDQRRLEIARALAGEPKLLLLDEPAAGMNPTETAALGDLVRGLRDEGLTILLVEHDMRFVMGLCDRITVLSFGRKIAEGGPAEIRADPAVIEAYLGARAARRLQATAAAP